nr:hypothetical protein [Pandoraea faecigallinarum]
MRGEPARKRSTDGQHYGQHYGRGLRGADLYRFRDGAIGNGAGGEFDNIVLEFDELVEKGFTAGIDAGQPVERRAANPAGPDLPVDADVKTHGFAVAAQSEAAVQKGTHGCLRNVVKVEKRTALPKILARSNSIGDIATVRQDDIPRCPAEKKPT